MRKKTNSIIVTIFTATIVTLPHAPKIISEGTLLSAAAVAAVISIPSKCEASIVYGAYASIAILSQPSTCEASITDQLCAAITSFLDGEAAKADTAAKGCTGKCPVTQKKRDVIGAAQKKVNDSCAKGLTPDITEVGKGLDKNAQEKLGKLYNMNSRMFDGTADRPDKDFNVTSNPTPALTGKSGQVSDLKTSDPYIKAAPITEFSLANKPPVLLTSAKTTVPAQKTEAATYCTPYNKTGEDVCIYKDGDIFFTEGQIRRTKDLIEVLNSNLAGCISVKVINCDGTRQRLANANADLACYTQNLKAITAAGTKCRKCSDGLTYSDEAGKCRNECSKPNEWVNGNCVAACTGGQTRNAVNGKCECAPGYGWVDGICRPEPACICSGGENLGPWPPEICTKKCDSMFPPEPPLPDETKKQGRPLTAEEKKWAQAIFGNTIKPEVLDKIRIKTMENMTQAERDEYKKKLYTAKTSGYIIYFPKYDPTKTDNQAILIHELTHIYQRKNYGWVGYKLGALADWWKLKELKLGDWTLKEAEDTLFYDDADLTKKSFRDFGLDQQAEIIRYYYYEAPARIGQLQDDIKSGQFPPAEVVKKQKDLDNLIIKQGNIEKLLRDAKLLK